MNDTQKESVVHIGRYHRKDDIRIFCKECSSLIKDGYRLSYITSDVNGDSRGYEENGIQVSFYQDKDLSLGIRRDILKCIYLRKKWIDSIVDCILELEPDILHIHEYEILFVVKSLLKRKNDIKIVYDIHEDTPRQLSDWYRRNGRKFLAFLSEKIIERKENRFIRKADLVITATDYIHDLVIKQNKNVFVIKNFPKADDICCSNDDLKERTRTYCYSGGISEDRGITLLIKNSDNIKGRFILAGNMAENYRKELEKKYQDKFERNVDYRGYLSRQQVNELYSSSVVGLCTLQYQPNYINALPIKLFEYMAAGIPVVASDFPLWKQIVEEAECGILVNPYDEEEIVKAVNRLLFDRELAKKLGDNGRHAVQEMYSWEHEESILLEAYRSILSCVE